MDNHKPPLKVICWLWKPAKVYRSQFTTEHVNILRAMVERNLHRPYEFCCITDCPQGLDERIRVIPLWETLAKVGNPLKPNCYRRLRAFSKEAKELIGERIFSLDLDCVITGDITPLVDRQEDFVIWGDTAPGTYYNGSLWLLRAGTRTQVWETFDPKRAPELTRKRRMIGSDQAWIGYALGPDEAKWGIQDGVYSYRVHLAREKRLPENARIVLFHGQTDPCDRLYLSWVHEHYRV